jgi:hypothetical protein
MTKSTSQPKRLTVDPQSIAVTAPSETLDRRALQILRGVQRVLRDHTFASLCETPLASGRRADVLAIDSRSEIWIIEIKSSIADFRSDQKWPEYQEYCDRFFFAVAPDFPTDILPSAAGLILADSYGGEILRMPSVIPLAAARRKAVSLSFALLAARRLHALADPPVPAQP